jgi:hypothetical protein
MCAYIQFKYYHKTTKVSQCLYEIANEKLFPELILAKKYCDISNGNIITYGLLIILSLLLLII